MVAADALKKRGGGGVAGAGQDDDAGKMVVVGTEEFLEAFGRGGEDDVVVVDAKKFGKGVEEFAGLAEEQEAEPRVADGGGSGLGGFGEIREREPDAEGGAEAFL